MTLCLLCPGQGSQTPDMLTRLASDPLLAPVLARLAPLAGDGEGEDVAALAADEARCFLNRHAQPLLVLHGLVVGAGLGAAGVTPMLVAGYSVGELTAHALAGALSPQDALRLAHSRAAAMDAAAPAQHGMLAVRGVAMHRLSRLAEVAGAVVAIVNGEDHGVLAGGSAALAGLESRLQSEHGAHVVPLRISVPAHGPWLAAGVGPFAADLASSRWQAHRCPVLAGVDAQPVETSEAAIRTLSCQIAQPVQWARVLDAAVEMGARCFFEVGPGNGLVRMTHARHPDVPARSMSDFSSLAGALAWLKRNVG